MNKYINNKLAVLMQEDTIYKFINQKEIQRTFQRFFI